MCFAPKIKSNPIAAVDPNAGKAEAEALAASRRRASGFASTLQSTPQSRQTGSPGTKLLLGQ